MDENKVTYFGQTDSRNKKTPFGIKRKDRSKHMYVIGKTGMGKSTLLENMAVQDIQSGEGMAFIDPHGKTAELLLEYVPEHRIKDVLYFAPFDMEYPISFNVMEDVGPDKRHLVANGLMSTFEKIWVDAWSARMAYILNNTILALLEYPGSTLLSVNRMLADKDYRKKVVENVTDVSVKSFWVDEFGKYTEKFAAEATPAIQNKVGQFTSNPLIRNIIGQPTSTFDIRKMMDERKILIINLSKGRVGEGNANLLGSMLITKIYLAAMSRADIAENELRKLPNFYLYVDEFQSFANKSFADILSEARKYKLNLTIAHQYIEQMEEEVRAAVFGNVGTMTTFRVGAYDAEVLEKEFAPQFTAVDLVNLGAYQIYLKLMIDGISSQPFSATTLPPISKPIKSSVNEIIAMSRAQFGNPRAKVEETIKLWHESSRVTGGAGSGTGGGAGKGIVGAGTVAKASTYAGQVTQSVGRRITGPNDPSTPREMLKEIASRESVPTQPTLNKPAPVVLTHTVARPSVPPSPVSPVSTASPAPLATSLSQSSPKSSSIPSSAVVSEPLPIRPVSLNELKQKAVPVSPILSDKAKKERSPENVSALKAALASVLKDAVPASIPSAEKPKTSKVESSALVQPSGSVEKPSQKSAALREVPKEVLEQLLSVPNNIQNKSG
jgi:energy-coupling factor transporter ATP-binding protein EcfA2